ncbi:hypothetical protein MPH_10133 [Macrophomina phaseolina MS6]|uniref:Uncharacterized protein n=1 Tax=Macrophomina phaseolina (strain MS6) TaxID=1126212 RepID=K2S771_MACPH|nr:hypothetical protein MPH_10133 [Macrophomina phaseolina MS6]
MPTRRHTRASYSIFENHAIVAQANSEHGVWTECSLSLKFNQARSRGMISLQLTAEFNEVDIRHVTLRLSPEDFQRLDADSDPGKIPASIKQHLGRITALRSYDQVVVLSLAMDAPGRLVTPYDVATLTPIREHQIRVQNFQCLCRATHLLLYIPTLNLPQSRQSALENFIDLAHAGDLTSISSHLYDAYNGRGGRESTWDIFNVLELPPSYEQQSERSTAKRTREASPASQTDAPKKRLANEAGAAKHDLPAYISNSDSDTDFSHLLLSPLRPSHTATSPRSGPPQPTAAAQTALHGTLLQEAIRAELNTTLLGFLREMLPGLLREMLPELVRACLRDLLPDALNHLLFPASPSSQDSEKSSSDLFIDRIVEPIVLRHLPQVVRDYIELEDPLENYMGAADVEIKEASYNAVLEIKEAKEGSIAEIKLAETDVVERLTGVDWNVIGKEIMGLTPSQQSYSQRSNAGAGTAAVRQDALDQEGGQEVEYEEPGEHPLMEDGICTSEAQRCNRLLTRPGLGYGSQATTADETEGGSPAHPSSESLRSRSELSYGSRDSTRENLRTGTPNLQAPASDHSVQAMEAGKEAGLEMGSRRNSTDNIDIGEAPRDESEDCGENGRRPSTQQRELYGMAGAHSWMYATTEPDTESDPSGAG